MDMTQEERLSRQVKISKAEAKRQAQALILTMLHAEIDNPSEFLDKDFSQKNIDEIYIQLKKIYNTLNNKWPVLSTGSYK